MAAEKQTSWSQLREEGGRGRRPGLQRRETRGSITAGPRSSLGSRCTERQSRPGTGAASAGSGIEMLNIPLIRFGRRDSGVQARLMGLSHRVREGGRFPAQMGHQPSRSSLQRWDSRASPLWPQGIALTVPGSAHQQRDRLAQKVPNCVCEGQEKPEFFYFVGGMAFLGANLIV